MNVGKSRQLEKHSFDSFLQPYGLIRQSLCGTRTGTGNDTMPSIGSV